MRTSKRRASEQHPSAPIIQIPKRPPTEEQIRQRAREIHLARGGATGRELDDWLQAERELQAGNPSFIY